MCTTRLNVLNHAPGNPPANQPWEHLSSCPFSPLSEAQAPVTADYIRPWTSPDAGKCAPRMATHIDQNCSRRIDLYKGAPCINSLVKMPLKASLDLRCFCLPPRPLSTAHPRESSTTSLSCRHTQSMTLETLWIQAGFEQQHTVARCSQGIVVQHLGIMDLNLALGTPRPGDSSQHLKRPFFSIAGLWASSSSPCFAQS